MFWDIYSFWYLLWYLDLYLSIKVVYLSKEDVYLILSSLQLQTYINLTTINLCIKPIILYFDGFLLTTYLSISAVDAPPQPQVDGTAPTFSKKPTIRQVKRSIPARGGVSVVAKQSLDPKHAQLITIHSKDFNGRTINW